MKQLLFCTAMLFGIASCNHQTVLPSRDKIHAQFVTIDTRRDTTLRMKDGLEIVIPANALSAPGHSAKLEVKEALDIQTMISGDLVTKSNGKLLSSGGMFRIDVHHGMMLNNEELQAIFTYIEEKGRRDFPFQAPAPLCDSCQFYQWHLNRLKLIARHKPNENVEEDFVTRTDTRNADTIPGDPTVIQNVFYVKS